MLSPDTVQAAKEFTRWKSDPNVDQTYKCNYCGKYYDYRIFLIHKCEPVATLDYGFIPTV